MPSSLETELVFIKLTENLNYEYGTWYKFQCSNTFRSFKIKCS